jgi:hypothetical protein
MTEEALKAHQVAGQIDMIIRRDNVRWLRQHFYDSWQPEDNLALMRT